MILDNGGLRLDRVGEWRIEGDEAVFARWPGDRGFHLRVDAGKLVPPDDAERKAVWRKCAELPAELQSLPPVPKTVDAAVAMLKQKVPAEDQVRIADMTEDDLIGMHMGMGMGIRNSFGLWGGNFELLASCGSKQMHPDDASEVIMHAFWKSLREARPDYPEILALEKRLTSLRVLGFPIRGLTLPEIVQALNERIRQALPAQDLPGDGLTFVLLEGEKEVSAETRNKRFYINPVLKPWRVSREAALPLIEPLSALRMLCTTRLRPPGKVEAIPRYWSGWFRSEMVLQFEEVEWGDDSFDVAIRPPASAKDYPVAPKPTRSAEWKMAGDPYPMSPADAVGVLRKLKAVDPQEEPIRISILEERQDGTTIDAPNMVRMGPRPVHESRRRLWAYEVVAMRPDEVGSSPIESCDRGYLRFRDRRGLVCLLQSNSLNDECRWSDHSKDLSFTPAQAIARVRAHLQDVYQLTVPPECEGVILHRVPKTDRWFYEVRLEFPDEAEISSVYGLVMLDGRVLPFTPEESAE